MPHLCGILSMSGDTLIYVRACVMSSSFSQEEFMYIFNKNLLSAHYVLGTDARLPG